MKADISKERAKRWAVFFLSLFFMGNGIALVTNAQLGTTPISSVPYVVARIFGISMGTGTFIINTFMLLAQIPLLGKTFRPKQFLQLPCVFVFSLFIDLGMWISHSFIPELWHMRMGMTLVGCGIMAFGIMLEIASNTIVIPGEGFVLALAYRTKLPFGNLKIINDVTLVCLAALLGWLCLGRIEGLREGTVVTAFLTGVFIRFFSRCFHMSIERWFKR
ncbi:YitT family protein [Mailhella massiliensis]|uniref:DUF6198 family protein n=1 Tax=Mailhella massiliensis TaxID=1903261 RepID=A0A921DSA9_9BACT|nr:DUF6198 family protein [Mailhella massiliensis]HJD96767.1 DUF6198 family protein [Mailhella massiliensis]